MNDLSIFKYVGHDVRIVIRDGEPWFVASDVCRVISIANTAQAVSYLDEDEVDQVSPTIISNDGGPDRHIINEPGLYSLILRSRKPEAKAFKRWITHEVLPSIRKTGRYGIAMSEVGGPNDADQQAAATKRDLDVINSLGGIVDPNWRESLGRHAWAVYKGAAPDIAPDDRLLMAQPYLAERGVSGADQHSMATTFGKLVKAAYTLKYGREPGKVPALVVGRQRPVRAYYERDRPLFDMVFEKHYSHLASRRLAIAGSQPPPDEDENDRPMFMIGGTA